MLINLTYFKKSGKYYGEGAYESNFKQMFEVFDEVRILPLHPGLSGRWDGPILVTCDSETGCPGLVNLGSVRNNTAE